MKKARIDIEKSIGSLNLELTNKGAGSAGQVKRGSWLSRSIKVKLANEDVVLNRGSLIDYINSKKNEEGNKLSKKWKYFGGVSDKKLIKELSDIEMRVLNEKVTKIHQAVQKNLGNPKIKGTYPLQEIYGLIRAFTSRGELQTQEKEELCFFYRLIAAQKGMDKADAEQRLSSLYEPESDDYKSALTAILKEDEKFLCNLLEDAKKNRVDLETVINEAEKRNATPSEGLLALYIFAAEKGSDFSNVEKGIEVIKQLYPNQTRTIEEKSRFIQDSFFRDVRTKIRNLKNEKNYTLLKSLGEQLEKQNLDSKLIALELYASLSKSTGSLLWKDKAINLVDQIPDLSKEVVKKRITEENEQEFNLACELANDAPSFENYSKAIELCQERKNHILKEIQNANDIQKQELKKVLESLNKNIDDFSSKVIEMTERFYR